MFFQHDGTVPFSLFNTIYIPMSNNTVVNH